MGAGLTLLGVALSVLIYWTVFRAPLKSRDRSLATCGECGGTVESDAERCRHCGASFE